jgi:hypothetical protein
MAAIASEPLSRDPNQHLLLFDATEYVRAAYESSTTYMPLAISTSLAEWEDTRRNLHASPEEMNVKLHEARLAVEGTPTGIGLDEERARLLQNFDAVAIFSASPSRDAGDLLPSV